MAREHILREYEGVLPPQAHEDTIANLLSMERARYKMEELRRALGKDLTDQRVLEVGSGLGSQSQALFEAGARVTGIEIDAVSCRLATRIHLGPSFINASGESLPFKSGSFDVIVSYQVLEHSKRPERILAEMARVLCPGGMMHVVVPNYRSFWEGHYGVLWCPFLTPALAKIYVRLFGRRPGFIDGLAWITPRKMRGWTASLPLECDWQGLARWKERFEKIEIPPLAAGRWISPLLRLLKALRLNRIFALITARLGWHYPIILTAKKI